MQEYLLNDGKKSMCVSAETEEKAKENGVNLYGFNRETLKVYKYELGYDGQKFAKFLAKNSGCW